MHQNPYSNKFFNLWSAISLATEGMQVACGQPNPFQFQAPLWETQSVACELFESIFPPALSLSLSFSTLFGPLEPSTQLLDDQQADGLGEGCEEGAANARGDAQRDELLRASGGQEGMVRGRCRIPFSRPYQERTSQTMGFHGFEMGLGWLSSSSWMRYISVWRMGQQSTVMPNSWCQNDLEGWRWWRWWCSWAACCLPSNWKVSAVEVGGAWDLWVCGWVDWLRFAEAE